jgi:diaminopimelate epimerase
MGNPHLACLVDDDVAGLDLTADPGFDHGLFPDGVNVELVNVLRAPAEGADAHIRLRVVERGVGETRSCGTGACAAAYAALADGGVERGTVVVDVPGGRLSVRIEPETTVLTGPAVVVTAGAVTQEWLAG